MFFTLSPRTLAKVGGYVGAGVGLVMLLNRVESPTVPDRNGSFENIAEILSPLIPSLAVANFFTVARSLISLLAFLAFFRNNVCVEKSLPEKPAKGMRTASSERATLAAPSPSRWRRSRRRMTLNHR